MVLVVELKNQPALSPTVWLMYLMGGAWDVAAVIRTAMMARCRMVASLMAVHCGLVCVGLQSINKGRGVHGVNKV